VVVGAGPGGCVLSYLLARSGVETVLLERHADLDREFRGYFFQPLVLRLFEGMDVLALDHDEIRRPAVTVFERSYDVFGNESRRSIRPSPVTSGASTSARSSASNPG
jgi:2-polyprenyl-6-methoxyphenol hydroxylase-like FAD-dependent oxidoreductase